MYRPIPSTMQSANPLGYDRLVSILDLIQPLVEPLRTARRVVVLTGAGVSAESGIPTFRDAMTGLWAKYDPSQLATPQAFKQDPATVTRWYDERRRRCAACTPNAAHLALVKIQQAIESHNKDSISDDDEPGRFTLLTQNVDRLHQRAGSRNVIELHGSLHVWRCTATDQEFEPGPEPFSQFPRPSPYDPVAILRPGVVWFGEQLPEAALAAAHEAIEACDLFLSIGTSAVVQPAASFAHIAARSGAVTAEINREPTAISRWVNWSVIAKAGDALPALADEAFGA